MLRKLFGLDKPKKKKGTGTRHDIDTDSNYCPKCGDTYQKGVETCVECAIPLIPGSEVLAHLHRRENERDEYAVEITTDDELMTVQTGKLTYLKEQQQLLQTSGVPSLLAGDTPSKG